eukprot:TRINITY_DN3436_c0_g2_i3.p1 TRINITY_DN3436_c0_g2~~TRINITY_DN3436_c0_g2_i3.p1  ORF type:complete len:161 (-),score=66.55 TRINITY_DN3436_c0_g2_i3:278-760(-)
MFFIFHSFLLSNSVFFFFFFFLMIRRPPRSTLSSSSAASDVYKRQVPWVNARRIFHSKLVRKMAEMDAVRTLLTEGGFATETTAKLALESAFNKTAHAKDASFDMAFAAFLAGEECKTFISAHVSTHQTASLRAVLGNNAALLKKLLEDPALRKAVEGAL